MEAVSNVDWMQLWCDFRAMQWAQKYTYVKLDIHSRTFSEVYDVFYHGVCCWTLCIKPYSKVIKPTGGLIKIKNELLYKSTCTKWTEEFLRLNAIKFISVSRVDLCLDFLYFANGERPDKTLRRILTGELWKIGKSKFFCNGAHIDHPDIKKVTKLCADGTKHDYFVIENSFKVIGDNDAQNNYSYICWGSRNSDVRTYLYNKSKELREVHYKSYITQQWKANNIYNNEIDTWRLEFSIKSPQFDILSKKTGHVFTDAWQDFFIESERNGAIMALASKYFDIRQNTGQKRKDREESVVLLDIPHSQVEINVWQPKKDITRSDKVLLRKLDKVNDEIRLQKSSFYDEVASLKTKYADKVGLTEWCLSHGITLSEAYEREKNQEDEDLTNFFE